MSKRIHTVLDSYLDDERRHRACEDWLANSPDSELDELLLAASTLSSVTPPTLSPRGRSAARAAMHAAIDRKLARRSLWLRLPRALRVGMAAMLLLVVCFSALGALSQAALPGSTLYEVKRASERIWLGLPGNESDMVHRQLSLAARRAEELRQLSAAGRPLDPAAAAAISDHVDLALDAYVQLSPERQDQLREEYLRLVGQAEEDLFAAGLPLTESAQQRLLGPPLANLEEARLVIGGLQRPPTPDRPTATPALDTPQPTITVAATTTPPPTNSSLTETVAPSMSQPTVQATATQQGVTLPSPAPRSLPPSSTAVPSAVPPTLTLPLPLPPTLTLPLPATEQPSATPQPTLTPTEQPSATPQPTLTPTEQPSATPTPTEAEAAPPPVQPVPPTATPTREPSATPPTPSPPTVGPSATPTPTREPTEPPSVTPTPTGGPPAPVQNPTSTITPTRWP